MSGQATLGSFGGPTAEADDAAAEVVVEPEADGWIRMHVPLGPQSQRSQCNSFIGEGDRLAGELADERNYHRCSCCPWEGFDA